MLIDRAKELITSNECSVAAVTPSGEILTGSGSSVRPLLQLYELHELQLRGSVVADKIIGRAAACILCAAEVSEVFAFVMSRSGKELLDRYNIKTGYETLIPFISNIRGDDMCPMEKTVEGIDDLELCLQKLKAFAQKTGSPGV